MVTVIASVPLWYWALAAGLFGMCFGSFSSVLAYRWPREESVVKPRSRCTSCGHQLRWYENMPVLSWLALGRKCGSCRAPISWRYPALELVSGLLAATVVWHFGATWKGLAALVMVLALVPVTTIDMEHKLIPNVVVFPAAAIALVAMVLDNPAKWWVPVSAAAGAGGFLWLLGKVKPGGMGLGDAKLALLLGAVLGASIIPAFFIAFLAGSILGAILMAKFGMQARKYQIPFGPYLALGAIVALFVGPTLISLYTDRIH